MPRGSQLLCALMFAAMVCASPTRASLVGHWNFDGCTTSDASGFARDLTAGNSPTCVPGRVGDAWQLSGVDQYLQRTFDPAFTPGDRAWSVAVWVKTTSVAGLQFLVSWYLCGANPVCTGIDGSIVALGLDSGHPFWNVRGDVGLGTQVDDLVSNVADGQWHLVVGTISASRDSMRLYVDGALRAVAAADVGTVSSGPVAIPLEVGRWFRTGWAAPGYYFAGSVDEVRIYDEELSSASVAALYGGTTSVPGGERPGLSIDGPSRQAGI